VISHAWDATTAKRMQIDPYCQWRKYIHTFIHEIYNAQHGRACSSNRRPVNVVSSNIRVMQIFAGVREIWGLKQKSGGLNQPFSRFKRQYLENGTRYG